jgi:hypothetical protein
VTTRPAPSTPILEKLAEIINNDPQLSGKFTAQQLYEQMGPAEREALERMLDSEMSAMEGDASEGVNSSNGAHVSLAGDTPPAGMPGSEIEPVRLSAKERLAEDVAGVYFSVAMVVRVFNERDSVIIAQQALPCARGWVKLADSNPALKRWLKRVVSGNAYTALITAHISLAAMLMASHGVQMQDVAKLIRPRPRPAKLTERDKATYPGAAVQGAPLMSDFPPATGVTSEGVNPATLGNLNERRG